MSQHLPNCKSRCVTFTDDPLPPVSWTNKPPSEAGSKSEGSRKGKVRRRSKSVGANVVELAKKHWKGRPTTRETTPKIPYNDRLIMKPMVGRPPTADEYQTADGVPFPRKTGVYLWKCLIRNIFSAGLHFKSGLLNVFCTLDKGILFNPNQATHNPEVP